MFFLQSGTIEKSNEAEEEVYETINISKIKAQTPNLRVRHSERDSLLSIDLEQLIGGEFLRDILHR